jgi:hypothetical protein
MVAVVDARRLRAQADTAGNISSFRNAAGMILRAAFGKTARREKQCGRPTRLRLSQARHPGQGPMRARSFSPWKEAKVAVVDIDEAGRE